MGRETASAKTRPLQEESSISHMQTALIIASVFFTGWINAKGKDEAEDLLKLFFIAIAVSIGILIYHWLFT